MDLDNGIRYMVTKLRVYQLCRNGPLTIKTKILKY